MKVKQIHLIPNFDNTKALSNYCNGIVYELENGDFYYGCSTDVIQPLSKVDSKDILKLKEL